MHRVVQQDAQDVQELLDSRLHRYARPSGMSLLRHRAYPWQLYMTGMDIVHHIHLTLENNLGCRVYRHLNIQFFKVYPPFLIAMGEAIVPITPIGISNPYTGDIGKYLFTVV